MPGLTYADGIESAWALDIPAAQVDLLIGQLGTQGYFTESMGLDTGVELSTRINELNVTKTWPAVPELNALVRNVRRQGKLVSHREPLDLPHLPQPATMIASAPTSAAPVGTASVSTAPIGTVSATTDPINIAPINAAPINTAAINAALIGTTPSSAAPIAVGPMSQHRQRQNR